MSSNATVMDTHGTTNDASTLLYPNAFRVLHHQAWTSPSSCRTTSTRTRSAMFNGLSFHSYFAARRSLLVLHRSSLLAADSSASFNVADLASILSESNGPARGQLQERMLSVSSLRNKLPFNPVKLGIGMLVFASVVVLLAKPPYEPTKKEDPSKKSHRKIHRPEATLPVLENTLTVIEAARAGDIHDRTLLSCRESNAEPVLVRSIGVPDQLIVCTPEAFEDVLKLQFSNFPKGSYQCENLRDLLGDGIFAVDGEQWVHQRKTASNLFTMRALRDSMAFVIQRHAVVLYDILRRASESKETLDLFKLLNRFTIEAFTEIGFGVHMGCLDSEEEHPFQKAFDHAQRALLLRFVRPGWFWKLQKWLGVGAEGQLKNDIEVINKTVLDIVEKALAKRSSIGSGIEIDGSASQGKEKDIVSLFLGDADSDTQQLDPMFLRNIVVNFLIAGRDTTAQTLSWFFLNLAKNPDVETAIRNEIAKKLPNIGGSEVNVSHATMQDVSQLVYLEAALKETLRLHPPVPMIPKYVVEDTTLSDGTFVKAGSLIVLATYVMARLPQVWGPDAEEFKPERWIDPSTGKLIVVSAYKFASFNAGPRMCLGMNLAMLEVKLVVAGLLSKFHVEVLNPEDVTYDLSLTLPVKGALNVQVLPAALPSNPDFA